MIFPWTAGTGDLFCDSCFPYFIHFCYTISSGALRKGEVSLSRWRLRGDRGVTGLKTRFQSAPPAPRPPCGAIRVLLARFGPFLLPSCQLCSFAHIFPLVQDVALPEK
jgi:hypothetical protein